MPRFQSLSEVISKNIERYSRMNRFPIATPLALEAGQNLYRGQNYDTTGVLRWGFSVWGIDPVIGVDFATDEVT